MNDDLCTSGFLLVKTFERMRREYLDRMTKRWPLLVDKAGFSIPRTDVSVEEMPRQYRGVMRDPLQNWTELWRDLIKVGPVEEEYLASTHMWDLADAGKTNHDLIFALEDARVLLKMVQPPAEREIIWARRMDVADSPAPNTVLLGYEPACLCQAEHNSAVAECMFFAYWMIDGWNPEQLEPHHANLNKWGLFDTPRASEEYLEAYLRALEPGADEGEYDYSTVEVRAVE